MKIQQKCEFGDHYFEVDIKNLRVNQYEKNCPHYENYTEKCINSIEPWFNGIDLHLSRPSGKIERIRITEKFATCSVCEREIEVSRKIETLSIK